MSDHASDVSRETRVAGLQAENPAASVRAALNRAKAAARSRGLRPARPGDPGGTNTGAKPTKKSKPFTGGRDPLLVGDLISRQLDDLGWQADLAVGGVIGRWNQIVGDDVAAHCVPEAFEDRILTVRADSATWATQIQLLVPVLQRRLDEEVGAGLVERVIVVGPGARKRFGPRSTPPRRA